ncbi:MAG: hypothetical protein FWH04_08445 [Oscillospiraceae bacterium]|nr:hypothetical protein [Oscillospiraceae bacterium]
MYKKIISIALILVLALPLASAATGETNPAAPKSFKATNGMARQIDIRFKTVKGVDGYQIAVSRSKKFAKGKTSMLNHKGNKTGRTSKALRNVKGHTIKKCKGKKLTAGKTYHIRIRAYKTADDKTVYGSWTKPKSAKVSGKNHWPKTKTIRYQGKTWTYKRVDSYTIPDGFGGKKTIEYHCRYHYNNRTGKSTKNCIGRRYGNIFCAKKEKQIIESLCSKCTRQRCAKMITCKNCDKCHGGAINGWENCYKTKTIKW